MKLIRLFDIVASLSALIVLSPILCVVMIILNLTGEHKIFYFQQRVGFNQKVFNLVKFATMLENSPNMTGGHITSKNDPRVLPFGRLLRVTKLNEIPQLLNVLIGDMSLIGPRPLTPDMFNLYTTSQKQTISKCRPGLSGVGSIVFRAEEDYIQRDPNPQQFYADVIAPYKGSLEVWYYNNKGFRLYFLLIILTLIHVFYPKSQAVWSTLTSLPKLPEELKGTSKHAEGPRV